MDTYTLYRRRKTEKEISFGPITGHSDLIIGKYCLRHQNMIKLNYIQREYNLIIRRYHYLQHCMKTLDRIWYCSRNHSIWV